MAISYSQKGPDYSRNTALAGKTVYSNGRNVTYDKDGYATKSVNPNHSNYAGTTKSVKAQDKDAALRGESYTSPDTSGLTDWGDGTGMGRVSGSGSSRASRSTGGIGSAYDGSYGSSGYQSVYDAQKAAYDAAVARAVSQLTAQKTAVNDSYNDYARQAYIDKMGAERDIGQYLGARGVTGGAAESTLLGLNTSYADELRRIEQSRRETLGALDRAISDAWLTGDINSANAAAEAAKEQASLYAQEMAERRAAAMAQEQYERAETKEQQSWARSLAAQMLAAGRMPDDATLAAAGLTRTQAELLLAESEDAPAYTPTFTVAQVQSEINRALKYGTSLSANVLRDYEYYYGEPYGTATTSAYSASPARAASVSSKVSYDNGGYSAAEIQALQKWLATARSYDIAADGYWGPASKSATQMSAKDAMAMMQAALAGDGSGNGRIPAGLENVDGFDSANSYMKSAGVDNETRLGLLSPAEWNNRKKYGSSYAAVTNYNTYQEYVRAYCEYAVSK